MYGSQAAVSRAFPRLEAPVCALLRLAEFSLHSRGDYGACQLSTQSDPLTLSFLFTVLLQVYD